MSLNIPEPLLNLNANCGVFSLWMFFLHHGVDLQIEKLAALCQHDAEDGTYAIALAVALTRLNVKVEFYTEPDPEISTTEQAIYQEANDLNIPILPALNTEKIRHAIDQGYMAIVAYEDLDGVGQQSLVYSIDDHGICFFNSFEPLPIHVFDQQRALDGICRQVILIDDRTLTDYTALIPN